MTLDLARRPDIAEYAPFYQGYVGRVPDGDLLATLESQTGETLALLGRIPADRWTHRYAPGKWSLAESWLHVMDSERVFAYRALRFSRGDVTPLPGYDQDAWVPMSGADARTPASLMAEYTAVRSATMQLLRSLDEAAWNRMGHANGVGVSVRALAWIIAGHERHHVALTHDRYLA
jgi:hypothetical protein